MLGQWKSHPCDGPHLDEALNALAKDGYDIKYIIQVGGKMQPHPLNPRDQTLIPFLVVVGQRVFDPQAGMLS